eukprot:TRINITY_DN81_c0_g1_i1.p1 TRINITY_DN81_c0_g1~~TRINITY_DN81_c0_g1_i1.p1  ORF type:complete len:266 (-),score=79.15 TRINITY_DN81_c0_g1_i1:282-1079(-)
MLFRRLFSSFSSSLPPIPLHRWARFSTLPESSTQRRLPEDHPFNDGRFGDKNVLDPVTRIFTKVSAECAANHIEDILVDWSYLPKKEHKNGLEIIVQTHLFSGFPRVINVLKALEVANAIDEDVLQDLKKEHVMEESKPFEEVCRQGRKVMEMIYGKDVAKKLEERMYDTHPAIAYFMVDHGYGRTLARPGPTLLQREFATIAALAGQSCVPQMISHLRGCLRLGASAQQLRSILDQTSFVWGDDAQREADTVWIYFSSRYFKDA